jgi:hypothetical protein
MFIMLVASVRAEIGLSLLAQPKANLLSSVLSSEAGISDCPTSGSSIP